VRQAGSGEEEDRAPRMKAPPRVVLDTNVVLSALLFGGGWAARLRTGWQSGRFVPPYLPLTPDLFGSQSPEHLGPTS
jgi:hypothetical protein